MQAAAANAVIVDVLCVRCRADDTSGAKSEHGVAGFFPVDAERAAVPDRGAVSFTTVYSASVMSSRLPQRLTTPCEPVLRDAPVLDDAVEVLRVGPLGAAELLDADGAGVSCCGATPCPLAFSRRGWLPPPLRPPPPLPVGPLGPLRLPAPPESPFRRLFGVFDSGWPGDAPPRNALGPYFSDCPRICSVAWVSPIELMPAPIQRSTVSGKLCDSPKIMYITGSRTNPYTMSQFFHCKNSMNQPSDSAEVTLA